MGAGKFGFFNDDPLRLGAQKINRRPDVIETRGTYMSANPIFDVSYTQPVTKQDIIQNIGGVYKNEDFSSMLTYTVQPWGRIENIGGVYMNQPMIGEVTIDEPIRRPTPRSASNWRPGNLPPPDPDPDPSTIGVPSATGSDIKWFENPGVRRYFGESGARKGSKLLEDVPAFPESKAIVPIEKPFYQEPARAYFQPRENINIEDVFTQGMEGEYTGLGLPAPYPTFKAGELIPSNLSQLPKLSLGEEGYYRYLFAPTEIHQTMKQQLLQQTMRQLPPSMSQPMIELPILGPTIESLPLEESFSQSILSLPTSQPILSLPSSQPILSLENPPLELPIDPLFTPLKAPFRNQPLLLTQESSFIPPSSTPALEGTFGQEPVGLRKPVLGIETYDIIPYGSSDIGVTKKQVLQSFAKVTSAPLRTKSSTRSRKDDFRGTLTII